MISVIIPVYNAERYLSQCMDSILSQTYRDFEVILINDGSTDSSKFICEEYAVKDARVRVLHKQNGGVSSARNLGLKNAIGEWIVFCDADDYVSPYYLDNLYKAVDEYDIDLVFNYAVVHCNKSIEKENYPVKIINVNEISDMFLYNDLIWHTSPWSKLFKRSIINEGQLKYSEDMHIGEDALFLYSYILLCRKIRVICTCDYHYIIRGTESLTHRINSFVSEVKGLNLITNVVEQMRRLCLHYPQLNSKFDWLVGCYKRRVLIAMYHDSLSRKERLSYLAATDFSDYIEMCKEDSIQGRVYLWLLSHSYYKIYDFVRSTVQKIKI